MHLGLTRLYGRAPKGERLDDAESPSNQGQNISLVGGMSIDGLIATSAPCWQRQHRCVLVLYPGDSYSPTVGWSHRLDG